ncbi:hypothetical protein [Stutzerimonas nitrititolerans]|uniref:hypothetical protein n=1 Tax=Stutzerimonas nitrititolerans TaxID=2482751 RepID=UPI002897BADA|nr:glycogen branching protein [Stutzerimonas nitrititolerans]
MPKANVKTAFTFREGGKVKLYKKGDQELTAAALAHAKAHGFVPVPKAEPKPADEAK